MTKADTISCIHNLSKHTHTHPHIHTHTSSAHIQCTSNLISMQSEGLLGILNFLEPIKISFGCALLYRHYHHIALNILSNLVIPTQIHKNCVGIVARSSELTTKWRTFNLNLMPKKLLSHTHREYGNRFTLIPYSEQFSHLLFVDAQHRCCIGCCQAIENVCAFFFIEI